MRSKRAVSGILIALFTAGIGFTGVQAASAASGDQYCGDNQAYCLNAKGYGPWVDSWGYCQASGCSANDYTWVNDYNECNGGRTTSTCPGHGIPAGLGIGALEFTGGGTWNGHCIGDAYNLSSRADASLNICPSGSSTGSWGVNFVWGGSPSCPGNLILYNIHWNGYIQVPSNNGSQIYLNNSLGTCLKLLPYAPG